MIFEKIKEIFVQKIILLLFSSKRNIKPSSLYISPIKHEEQAAAASNPNEKTKLLLSDYGVLTAMKDALVKTRALPGSFDYQAPEVLDAHSFSYNSDIWSIGAVLLDICTTSLYDVGINS